MPATLDADNLRRWAMQCEDQANDPRASGYKRTRLMKMREALMVLADEEDLARLAARRHKADDRHRADSGESQGAERGSMQ